MCGLDGGFRGTADETKLHNEDLPQLCLKTWAWLDLVQSVQTDRTIVKKLCPLAPPLIVNTDPALLLEVIGTLFPPKNDTNHCFSEG
jgi:hypothetical protein